jgi:hypothetical protein
MKEKCQLKSNRWRHVFKITSTLMRCKVQLDDGVSGCRQCTLIRPRVPNHTPNTWYLTLVQYTHIFVYTLGISESRDILITWFRTDERHIIWTSKRVQAALMLPSIVDSHQGIIKVSSCLKSQVSLCWSTNKERHVNIRVFT